MLSVPGNDKEPKPASPPKQPMSIGDAIVERARQDVGRLEEGYNKGAVVRDLMHGTGFGEGKAWCAGAVSNWVNDAANNVLGGNVIATTAGTGLMKEDYMKAGAFSYFKGELANAKPGDTVFFTRGNKGEGHVAIVSANHGDKLTLIEGNVSPGNGNSDGSKNAVDGVYEKTFSIAELRERNIVGFGDNEKRAEKQTGVLPPQGKDSGIHVEDASLGQLPTPGLNRAYPSPKGRSLS